MHFSLGLVLTPVFETRGKQLHFKRVHTGLDIYRWSRGVWPSCLYM